MAIASRVVWPPIVVLGYRSQRRDEFFKGSDVSTALKVLAIRSQFALPFDRTLLFSWARLRNPGHIIHRAHKPGKDYPKLPLGLFLFKGRSQIPEAVLRLSWHSCLPQFLGGIGVTDSHPVTKT